MSKVLVNESSLSNIADAIREKNGLTDTYKPSEMATAITNLPTGGGGDIEVEPIVLTGYYCDYACAGPLSGTYINKFGNTVSTKDITSGEKMFFYNNTVKKIPFDINFKAGTSENLQGFYTGCDNLEEISLIHNVSPSSTSQMFYNCYRLREIPEGFGDDWNWDTLHTGSYAAAASVFDSCYSLRKIPSSFLNNMWNSYLSSYSTCYYSTFSRCYVLDEINGVAVSSAAYTSNVFTSHVALTHRLKNYTFQTNEDGTPKTAKWKSQTIDFSSDIGYKSGSPTTASTLQYITGYNSGITTDTLVTDNASYQALKDNPDWWTCDVNYSRYNHDSAVATINSLPDCSATGTNTIKFKGTMGAKTDGGAINTLTEEEIAVAAAKGWTVSLV
jgi:hypothetical protein